MLLEVVIDVFVLFHIVVVVTNDVKFGVGVNATSGGFDDVPR